MVVGAAEATVPVAVRGRDRCDTDPSISPRHSIDNPVEAVVGECDALTVQPRLRPKEDAKGAAALTYEQSPYP